jgi:2-polyprenyl-3-methyl-5-hydroxy-6-metoxy-1,4-benzoquinol methylase
MADPIRAIVRSLGTPGARAYARVRFTILRAAMLEEIARYLPTRGRVLDVGSGYGLVALYLALRAPGRQLTAIELDSARVAVARASAEALGVTNVEFEAADVLAWCGTSGTRQFDAIYMIDVLHHLPAPAVAGLLGKLRTLLAPGGTLVIKDIAPRPLHKMLFTLALDRLMVGWEPIRYWPTADLRTLLEGLGFDVRAHRMNDVLPYSHVLYICRLPAPSRAGGSMS